MVEGRLRDPPPAVGACTGSVRRLPERAVELVAAHDGTVLERRVVGDQPERQHLRLGLAGGVECLLELDPPFGERAGLVREQHLDVAEVLDRDEPLDDHRLPHQPAGTGRKADGDDRREQLRRHPDGNREREEQRLEQRPAQDGVEHEDGGRQYPGDDHEHARVGLQAPLEGGLLVALAEPQGDAAECRARPGLHHHGAALAAVHDRAHERAGGQIERGVAAPGRGRLRSRRRLARQDRLVALEAIRREQPQVRGHDVSHPEAHDVAGHERDDVDLLRLPVALDEGGAADLRVERLDRLLGAVLVDEAEPDAQGDDRQDDPGRRRLADRRRDHRRRYEEHEQEAAELASKHAPGAGPVTAQDVRAELVQPPPRLLACEPSLAAAETTEHCLRLENCRPREVEVRARRARRGQFNRLHSPIVALATRSDAEGKRRDVDAELVYVDDRRSAPGSWSGENGEELFQRAVPGAGRACPR